MPSSNSPWQMLTNPAMFGITMLQWDTTHLDVWCQPYPKRPDYPGIIQITLYARPQPLYWLMLEWAALELCPSQVIETSRASRATWMHPPWHSAANIVKQVATGQVNVSSPSSLGPSSSSVAVCEVSKSTMLGGGSLFCGSTFHVTGGGNYTLMCTLSLRKNKQRW